MGYKIEYFVEEVDENLICPICKDVFKEPVNCQDGHSFCKVCIEQSLRKDNKCPNDGKLINKWTLSPNFALRGFLEIREVVCHTLDDSTVNAHAGVESDPNSCEWTGKLKELAKHRETCSFQQVQCLNRNCNTKIQRRQLEKHDKSCEFKIIFCEECHLNFARHQLDSHKDSCEGTLILCPNKCTNGQGMFVTVKRRDINNHLTIVCGKALVDCPFKDQGCSVQVERQDVNAHVEENMAAHMMLLARQCSFLTEQNSLLTEQNSSLTEHCSTLTEESNKLKEKLGKVQRNIKNLQVEILNKSHYVWKIHDYRSQSRKYNNGSWIRSPTFWLCGYSWYLKLYPNGIKQCQDFVALYLVWSNDSCTVPNQSSWNAGLRNVLVQSRGVSVTFARITVKSQDQGPAITHNLEVEFDDDKDNSRITGGTTRGEKEVAEIKKLISVADSLSPSYCNTTDDFFTITCILW